MRYRVLPLIFLTGCAVEMVFPSRHVSIQYPEDGSLMPEEFSIIVASYSSSPGFYQEAFGGDVLYRSVMFRASRPPFRIYIDGREYMETDTPLITLSLHEGRHSLSVRSGSFLAYRSHSIEVEVAGDFPYRLMEWRNEPSVDSGVFFRVENVWIGGTYSSPMLYVDGKPIIRAPAPFPDDWALCDSSVGMFFVGGNRFFEIYLNGRIDTSAVGGEFRGVGCVNGFARPVNWSGEMIKAGKLSFPPPSGVSGNEVMGMFVHDSLVLFSAGGGAWMWRGGGWVGAYVPVKFSYLDCRPAAMGIVFIGIIPIPYVRFHATCRSENPAVTLHGSVVSVDGIFYKIVPSGK